MARKFKIILEVEDEYSEHDEFPKEKIQESFPIDSEIGVDDLYGLVVRKVEVEEITDDSHK